MAKPTKKKPLDRWQLQDAARLRALWDAREKKLSQQAFGERYGIGDQGLVTQYLNGHIALNLKVAIKFARGLGVSVSEISPTLAKELSQLPDNEPGPELRAKIPVISWTTAGHWADVQDPFQPGDAEDWIYTTKAVGPNAFALRVVGDSMEPKLPDGSTVIIDPSAPYGHGKIVLAKRTQDQQATLKQLWYDGAVPKLRPLNPRYDILDMPDDTRIIGVAVKLELDL